jgi:hypothetical protein
LKVIIRKIKTIREPENLHLDIRPVLIKKAQEESAVHREKLHVRVRLIPLRPGKEVLRLQFLQAKDLLLQEAKQVRVRVLPEVRQNLIARLQGEAQNRTVLRREAVVVQVHIVRVHRGLILRTVRVPLLIRREADLLAAAEVQAEGEDNC